MWTKEQIMNYSGKLKLLLDPTGMVHIYTVENSEMVFEDDFYFETLDPHRFPSSKIDSSATLKVLNNFSKNLLPLYVAAVKLYGDNSLKISEKAYMENNRLLPNNHMLYSRSIVEQHKFWELLHNIESKLDATLLDFQFLLGIGSIVKVKARGAFYDRKGTVVQTLYTHNKRVFYLINFGEINTPKLYLTYSQLEVLDAKFRYENAEILESACKRLDIQEFKDENKSDLRAASNYTPAYAKLRKLVDRVRQDVATPLNLSEFQTFVNDLIAAFKMRKHKGI